MRFTVGDGVRVMKIVGVDELLEEYSREEIDSHIGMIGTIISINLYDENPIRIEMDEEYEEECFMDLWKEEELELVSDSDIGKLKEINERWEDGELSWEELKEDYLWLKDKCNELIKS